MQKDSRPSKTAEKAKDKYKLDKKEPHSIIALFFVLETINC
jgi:hypothetical protein